MDVSCLVITYAISSNFCKKRFSGMLSALQFSIFLVSSFIEDFLFILFQQKNKIKKENTLMGVQIFTILLEHCLTSKISKEIWQMAIWSENMFKENLMLQFSWLQEFRYGKFSGWWTLDKLQYENSLRDQL